MLSLKMGKKGERHDGYLTIRQKQQLIEYESEGPKKTQDDIVKWVSDTFRVKISRSTVSKILKKKDALPSNVNNVHT